MEVLDAIIKAAKQLAKGLEKDPDMDEEEILDFILDHELFVGWDTEDEDLFDERLELVTLKARSMVSSKT